MGKNGGQSMENDSSGVWNRRDCIPVFAYVEYNICVNTVLTCRDIIAMAVARELVPYQE